MCRIRATGINILSATVEANLRLNFVFIISQQQRNRRGDGVEGDKQSSGSDIVRSSEYYSQENDQRNLGLYFTRRFESDQRFSTASGYRREARPSTETVHSLYDVAFRDDVLHIRRAIWERSYDE